MNQGLVIKYIQRTKNERDETYNYNQDDFEIVDGKITKWNLKDVPKPAYINPSIINKPLSTKSEREERDNKEELYNKVFKTSLNRVPALTNDECESLKEMIEMVFVYNTDTKKLQMYIDGGWKEF